ncbi:MAG: ABC transporter substrate-binding protein [Burkholderiales bacterium]
MRRDAPDTGRRRVVGALALALVSVARAQSATPPRVGILIAETVADQRTRLTALTAGLADLGYVDGRTVTLEIRAADGRYERLPALARELVERKVAVLVAFGVKALVAAHQATTRVPIVIPFTTSDPVAMGVIGDLKSPTRNVTGTVTFGPELMAKRLELLGDLMAGIDRVAILRNPANASFGPTLEKLQEAARRLHMQLATFDVRSAAEVDGAVAAIARARMEAVLLQGDTLLAANARRIAQQCAQRRLPSVGSQEYAAAGGLLGYGANEAALYRRGAYFVDRLLKGARPGDLPIEQATTFELVVNQRTATALDLRIPQALRIRADTTIE